MPMIFSLKQTLKICLEIKLSSVMIKAIMLDIEKVKLSIKQREGILHSWHYVYSLDMFSSELKKILLREHRAEK